MFIKVSTDEVLKNAIYLNMAVSRGWVMYRDITSTMTFFLFSRPEIYLGNTPVHCVLFKNAESPFKPCKRLWMFLIGNCTDYVNASVTSNHGPCTDPARESPMFFISYGTRTGPVRDSQWCRTVLLRTRRGIDTTRICKNPARASYVAVRAPCGSARAVRGLFMVSKSLRGS